MALRYPDGQPPTLANKFNATIGNSTSTVQALAFNFGASIVKVVVDSGGPGFFQFNGNPATTNDYLVSSGDFLTDWFAFGTPVSIVSVCQVYTTSASTGGFSARVGAFG